jgi:putative phosphoribosyl transferase
MPASFVFSDRRAAGIALGECLAAVELEDPVVVGLPRGGVPVAHEVARALGAPLDVGLVRKLGAPGQPELGIGALGEDGTLVIDRRAVADLAVGRGGLAALVEREQAELERQRALYRGGRSPVDVRRRTVVLVDDGLATGVTATAAARVLRARGAKRVVLGVPVCPVGTGERLRGEIDELVCLEQPRRFGGVGAWYEDFSQTSDSEVIGLLRSQGEC